MSTFEPRLYDFGDLVETLEKQLPAHKKHALLLAVPTVNLEIISKKKEVFQHLVKYYAALSVLVTSSNVLDELIIEYQSGFGLDCESLQKLADRIGLPLSDLKAVMKTPLTDVERVKALFTDILSLSARTASVAIEDEKFNFFSAIGLIGSVALSCWSTYNSINRLLDMFADDAQRVFTKMLDHVTAVR